MAYETSPERHEVVRVVVRAILLVGTILAVWLIAPAAANALEPPTSLDDAEATDAAAAVAEAADDATGTVTEAADDATGTVTDAADAAVDTDGSTAASVKDAADDAVSTAQDAGDAADDVARRLRDATSTVDIQDTTSVVEVIPESVTPVVPTEPLTDGNDGMAGAGHRDDVSPLRFADDLAFTSTVPGLTTAPMAEAMTSDAGAAATSSTGGARDTPATPDGVPPPAMGSTARDLVRGGSPLDDLAAVLAAIMIALGLVRWSRREAETSCSPVFLSLAGRPG